MKKVSHFLKTKIGIAVGAVVVILIGWYVAFGSSSSTPKIESTKAVIGDVVEKVSVTGKVTPMQKADLSFEKGGILGTKLLKVGDKVTQGQVMAALDTGESYASLQGAEANLASEQAKLAELQKGLRSEEATVEQSKVDSAQIAYDNAKKDLVNAIRSGYSTTYGAIRNKIDTFFNNAQSVNPEINIYTESSAVKDRVNFDRIVVGEQLTKWKADIDTYSSVDALVTSTHERLDTIKKFLNLMITITGGLTTGNSGVSQTTIDGYSALVNTAYSSFSSVVTSIGDAEAVYKNTASNLALANDQYALKKAGSTSDQIDAQKARVDQAAANVANYKAVVGKTRIVSPLTGIVTRADSEVGEYVAPGSVVYSVMTDDTFKIEVNVPESDIASVSIGNTGTVTLDAYGSDVVFPVTVTAIDPAELIVEGVPTYKVTLVFDEKDARIRSGMTANIDLITQHREGVVTIPFRAVHDKVGQPGMKIVKVLDADGETVTDRSVVVGVRGSNGMVEIVSGVQAGDSVVTNAK